MTIEQWRAEGIVRFGTDPHNWKFVCPLCGNVASVEEFRPFKDKGATPESAFQECIGRYTGGREAFGGNHESFGEKDQPCNYAAYGLFKFGPVKVTLENGKEIKIFDFAPAPKGAGTAHVYRWLRGYVDRRKSTQK